MKKLPFALLAFCFGAILISAKDYKITQNANWMITLNGESFHQSRMGKFIMGKMNEAPDLHQKMQGLKNAFGVDLMEIREIYAFGSGEKDQGTAFFHGGINSKQLEGFATLNDKVEIDEFQNTKTYTFQKGALGVLSKDSVVVSSNKELLHESLKSKKISMFSLIGVISIIYGLYKANNVASILLICVTVLYIVSKNII